MFYSLFSYSLIRDFPNSHRYSSKPTVNRTIYQQEKTLKKILPIQSDSSFPASPQ